MEKKTVQFRGNAPGLNKPLPTGAMVYNPESPPHNQPYTRGEIRAAEAAQERRAAELGMEEPEIIVPPTPIHDIPLVAPVEPPMTPNPLTLGQQRAASIRTVAPPAIPAPSFLQKLGEKRVAEVRALREAKKNERITNAGSNTSSTSNASSNASNASSNASNASSNASNASSNASNASSNASNASNSSSNVSNASSNTSNASSNTNGLNEANRSAFDSVESEDTQVPLEETNESKKVPYDRTLPHLLRIGDDSTSEYIELQKLFSKTTGAFNAHYIGSFNELKKLYGVTTPEQIKGMQYAFGVKQYGQPAPIQAYIQKGCRTPYITEVKQAMKRRIQTLQESITMKGANMNTLLDKHKKQYLETLILNLETKLVRECRPDELLGFQATSTQKIAPSKGCPCLDDLSLLRDLTYIVALLQGTVHPEVKEQLDSIELGTILNVLRNNSPNHSQAKSMLATAIQTLEGLGKPSESVNQDEVNVLLHTIYTHFEPSQSVPEPLTEDIVITMLENKIKLVEGAASDFSRMTSLQAELDAKIIEMNALQAEVDRQKSSGTTEQIAELQARLERCEASLTATQAARNIARQNLDTLETQRNTANQRVNELKGQLERAKADKEKAITGLRAARATTEADKVREVATLLAEVATAEEALAHAEATITTKEAELAAALLTLEGARSETDRMKVEREAANQEKGQLTERLAEITETVNGLEATANQRIRALNLVQESLTAANEQIASLQNQLAEARVVLASKTSSGQDAKNANEALRKQVEDLTAQLLAKDAERQQLEEQMNELVATTRQQLDEVRAQLDTLQSSLLEKESHMAEKEGELAECKQTVRELEEAFVEANRKFTEAEQIIQGNEKQIQGLEEALRKCQVDSFAAVAEKEAALAIAMAQQAAALADKEAEKEAALASKDANTTAALAAKNVEQQAKNAAAKVAQATLQTEIASLDTQLRLAQAAAEQARRNAETSVATEKDEKEGLLEQLAEAQARVAALENMLQQKNTNSASALQQAIDAAETKQSNAIQTMRNEKDKEKEASLKVEREQCSKQIADMNERLRRLEQEKESALQKKQEELLAKQSELNTTRNAGAAATEAATKAAEEASQRAQEAFAAKEKEIADTKAALEAAQAKQVGLDAKLIECEEQAKRITEQTVQLSAKDAALAAKEAEWVKKQFAFEAAEAASQSAQTELESIKKQADGKNVRIHSLSRNLQTAEEALATAKANTTPEGMSQMSQERLATLLSLLIVDETVREQAQEYLSMKGDKIPGEITGQKTMMCNFFKYLYDVVKVQMNEFRTFNLYRDNVKGKLTHLDIFQIFVGSTIKDIPTGNMLKDLTNVLQYFFTLYKGDTMDVNRKAVPGMYMSLQKLYNVLLIKDGSSGGMLGPLDPLVSSEKMNLLLNKFGPLSTLSLESSGNDHFYFVEKNIDAFRIQGQDPKLKMETQGRFIPLIILAIKMIQLLYDEVTLTYTKMDGFCGYLKPTAEFVPRKSDPNFTAKMLQTSLMRLEVEYKGLKDTKGKELEAEKTGRKFIEHYEMLKEKNDLLRTTSPREGIVGTSSVISNLYNQLKAKYKVLPQTE